MDDRNVFWDSVYLFYSNIIIEVYRGWSNLVCFCVRYDGRDLVGRFCKGCGVVVM